MSRNFKIFLVSFAASLPIWWGMDVLSANLTEFFFVQELRTNPATMAALATQLNLERKLQDAYPLVTKGSTQLQLPARSILSLYVKENGSTKVLFEKNSEAPLPIASITKLMTALVAIKNYPPEERVTITPTILETPGEAGQLRYGDVLTVKDLLYLALMESSNDAAVALTEPFGSDMFVSLMNKEVKHLSLQNTVFENTTGLDTLGHGNISSARDLAAFARYLFENYPQIFDILSQSELPLTTSSGIFHHKMQNTNELLGYYEWPTRILGGKTGTTEQARETLLLVVESPTRQGYIINIVLGSEDRFTEMRQLLRWILQAYQWKA